MIEVDVETNGVQPAYHEAFSYQFFDGTNGELIWVGDDNWRERVQHWFDRARVEGARAWNTKFDWAFAEKHGFDLPPEDKWFDGMIGAHVLDERRSVALKSVGASLGFGDGADLQKGVKSWLTDERKRRAKAAKENGTELEEPTYADVPRDQMAEYAMEDVYLTRKVCDHQDALLAQTPELQGVVDFEHEVLRALYAVERRGFPVDEEGYRRLEIEVAENLEKLDDRVQALARIGVTLEDLDAFEFNPKSSKQVLAALKRREADLTFVTNDSMDAENLETVDDELAMAILDFRAEFKALSTYVRPYIGKSYDSGLRAWKMPFVCPDGRIHAGYRQLGARTGRMSSNDPNVQNQPRDDLRLRYNFRAEPGMKLVTCDLNSVEMAIFAAYAGEGKLLDAIKTGTDMHTMTADFVGLRDRQRPGGIVESRRQRGKVFNFSIVYGAGERSVRKQFRVNQDEARKMINRYHDAYPEVGRLQARIEWRLQDTGYIKSAWGRRFRVDPRDAYKGVNYLVQGTAADVLKAALIRMHKQGLPIVALVHDEAIAHCREEDAEEVKHAMIEALIDHPRITDKVPLAAEGDIVDRWSQAKNPDFMPRWAQS